MKRFTGRETFAGFFLLIVEVYWIRRNALDLKRRVRFVGE